MECVFQETFNKFDYLVQEPKDSSRPAKKMALSSSCSTLDKMDTSDSLQENSCQVEHHGKDSLSNPKIVDKSSLELNKGASVSREKIAIKSIPQKNKIEEQRNPQLPSLILKEKDQASKVKRLNYQFKSFNKNSSESQPKSNLGGNKKNR